MPVMIALAAALLAAEPATVKVAVLPTELEDSAREQVPKLFDDYVLTAVQDTIGGNVIGRDDINAMLGFEKQKALLGCDDVTCVSEIGGALGVDLLLAVKVARLGEEWVLTSKLINIRTVQVENRVNRFVSGDTKALLEAVPSLVRELLAKQAKTARPSRREPSPAPAAAVVPKADAFARPTIPDRSLGATQRFLGGVLTVGGAAATITGLVLASRMSSRTPHQGELVWEEDGEYSRYEDGQCNVYGAGNSGAILYTETGSDCRVADEGGALVGSLITAGGLTLLGWGTGAYLDGRAMAASGDPDATGVHGVRWLGWTMVLVTAAGPYLALEFLKSDLLAWTAGLGGIVGAGLAFTSSLWTDSARAETDTRSYPIFGFAPPAAPGAPWRLMMGLDF